VLEQLGERHTRYGVKARDYEAVGSAPLWTLEQGLGPAFTPAVKSAWIAVYAMLATTMQTGSGVTSS
jgi:hemoglobin-like flavoprotein